MNAIRRAIRVFFRRERRLIDAARKSLQLWERELDARSKLLHECEAGMHSWGKWKDEGKETSRMPGEDNRLGVRTWPLQTRRCVTCGLTEHRTYPVRVSGKHD